jgi:hypothetical protein
MSTDRAMYRVELEADQALHLGVGTGSGFSRATRRYVPGSTLCGAACGAWWREHPQGDQAGFDALLNGLSFGDAVASDAADGAVPRAAALDRRVCKAGTEVCSDIGVSMATLACPTCGAACEPAKGQRSSRGTALITGTRVSLGVTEQAKDELLFERQGLLVASGNHLVALAVGQVESLLQPGQVLRVGAAGTVAGRVSVVAVRRDEPGRLVLATGRHQLRVELLSPGVYVDGFGFASNRPTPEDLRWAFALPDRTPVSVDRAFTRWTTASGWHAAANRPKPEDAAVVAHSVFHISVTAEHAIEALALAHDLGLRTGEGYGWARLGVLEEIPDA